MRTQLLLLGVSIILISSCTEQMIEDHIAGTWELKSYHRNQTDETAEMKISNYEETYLLDGTYSRIYIDGKQHLVEEAGKFSINEDNWSMRISDVSSIADFSDMHSTLSTSTIQVEHIDKIELVYSFENGGDKHEFSFIKKE